MLLPLVGRNVQQSAAAISASASEGADLLIFSIDRKSYEKVLADCIAIQNVKVPIFLDIVDWAEEDSPSDVASNLLQLGASGVILSLDDMKIFIYETFAMFSNPQALDISIQDESQNSDNYEEAASIEGKPLVAGFTKLDDKEIELVEAERVILLEAIEVIRKAAPLVIF